ncbi:MAG: hypothetical protein D6819_03290 [Gammaproteobacteria bacterium]|nr:MAG: hypothetical protein D6819_03290 [Gammaproteobacteria bacterium]
MGKGYAELDLEIHKPAAAIDPHMMAIFRGQDINLGGRAMAGPLGCPCIFHQKGCQSKGCCYSTD